MTTFYDFSAEKLLGGSESMSDFSGKPVLVVNVASMCGKTPQYEGLEELWRRYRDSGLVVLGFPSNQFGEQEPGSSEEIATFCSTMYDVTFPLFAKIEVNGPNAHPLYAWLKSQSAEPDGKSEIGWNFTKFLIDRQGRVVTRLAADVQPADIAFDIESLL
jgi:glutathione peroxidase